MPELVLKVYLLKSSLKHCLLLEDQLFLVIIFQIPSNSCLWFLSDKTRLLVIGCAKCIEVQWMEQQLYFYII